MNVVVAGATGHEAALVKTLAPRVSAPCVPLDPADALHLPAELRQAAAGALGAIGLALGYNDDQGLPFDFLNPKRPAVQRNLKRIRILVGAVATVVGFMALLMVRKLLIDHRTRTLEAVSAELADAEKKRPFYRTLIGHATVVGDWIKGEHAWLQHLANLTAVLPPTPGWTSSLKEGRNTFPSVRRLESTTGGARFSSGGTPRFAGWKATAPTGFTSKA